MNNRMNFPAALFNIVLFHFSIETMSCKLLLSLVECIQQHSRADTNPNNEQSGYLLLSKILKVCVLKFKMVVKLYIPFLQNRMYVKLSKLLAF